MTPVSASDRASLEDAYNEACQALGDAIVRERLLTKALEELEADPSQDHPPTDPA